MLCEVWLDSTHLDSCCISDTSKIPQCTLVDQPKWSHACTRNAPCGHHPYHSRLDVPNWHDRSWQVSQTAAGVWGVDWPRLLRGLALEIVQNLSENQQMGQAFLFNFRIGGTVEQSPRVEGDAKAAKRRDFVALSWFVCWTVRLASTSFTFSWFSEFYTVGVYDTKMPSISGKQLTCRGAYLCWPLGLIGRHLMAFATFCHILWLQVMQAAVFSATRIGLIQIPVTEECVYPEFRKIRHWTF